MGVLNLFVGMLVRLVAWLGPWPLVAILIVSVLGHRWLTRPANPATEPASDTVPIGWWRRPLRTVFACGQSFAVVGLVLSFGPGSGMVREVRALDAHLESAMPAVTFRTVAGNEASNLESFRGRLVLLNIWATWCPPCRAEMPALDAVAQKYEDRGLVVVAVSDEERSTLQRYLADQPDALHHGYAFDLPSFLAGGVRPKSFLIDTDGTLRAFALGAQSEFFFTRWIEGALDDREQAHGASGRPQPSSGSS